VIPSQGQGQGCARQILALLSLKTRSGSFIFILFVFEGKRIRLESNMFGRSREGRAEGNILFRCPTTRTARGRVRADITAPGDRE
jgi:hypothetical protein